MPNRLAAESSPYLRQHADNPVDWRPWGAEALAEARAQEKPILLSIGYSACHWCHVMAHESFEDAATAAVMNDLYINIKVDREERPDLDKIYQLAHQALTRRGGGWPLTIFMTPDDHLPFYAGTYFPKEPRYGMPTFVHVLQQVRAFWDQRRSDVRSQNAGLAEFLADYGNAEASSAALSDATIHAALAQSARSFDPHYGGHAGAPKFPHCPEMEFLLDLSHDARLEPLSPRERGWGEGLGGTSDLASPDPHPALHATFSQGEKGKQIVGLTLERMAAGGIHDQLGGGFCRYSVDERWEIPHFEKMLYDNAQLLPLYARLGDSRTAGGILDWLQREMTAPSGGFYSALDADSEHEEGKFYVWQRAEVRALLTAEEFAIVEPHYGLDRPPNFEQQAWNPIVATALDAVATSLGITLETATTRLAVARKKLFDARSQRVRPGLDDKILTSWNALMIAGLARAARQMNTPALTLPADQALNFLYQAAWRDGRLYASAGKGLPAYLDDYAFLLDAVIESLQCRWSERDILWAIALADSLLQRFEDREHGGFFFTAHDHEALIQRPKPWTDEAIPCGNGVAARALLRLGHLLGEPRYLDAAKRTLDAAYSTMQQSPLACASLLRVLNDWLHPRAHVVVRYDSIAEQAIWSTSLNDLPTNRRDVYFISAQSGVLPGITAAQKYVLGGVAYICHGTNCAPPLTSPSDIGTLLGSAG